MSKEFLVMIGNNQRVKFDCDDYVCQFTYNCGGNCDEPAELWDVYSDEDDGKISFQITKQSNLSFIRFNSWILNIENINTGNVKLSKIELWGNEGKISSSQYIVSGDSIRSSKDWNGNLKFFTFTVS